MVTYRKVNEVVRNRCIKHQTKRMDSIAILLLIEISVGALIILIIKQTDIFIIKQTNQTNKIVNISLSFNIFLTIEE